MDIRNHFQPIFKNENRKKSSDFSSVFDLPPPHGNLGKNTDIHADIQAKSGARTDYFGKNHVLIPLVVGGQVI